MRLPIAATLALTLVLAPTLAAQTWTTKKLDSSLDRSTPPAVFIEGSLAVAATAQRTSTGWRVVASASADGGSTWGALVRLDSDNSRAPKRIDPSGVWIANGTIYVAWADDRAGQGRSATDLYFTRSTNGGASWDPERRINKGFPAGGNPIRAWQMHVAVVPASGAHSVYLLMTVDGVNHGKDMLYFVPSYDGGTTFAPPIPVSSDTADVDDFDGLITSGSRLVVTWLDDRSSRNQTFVRRTAADGQSWTSAEFALSSAMYLATEKPSVAQRGNRAMVAWQEEGDATDEQLLVSVSTNSGQTFGPPVKVGNYDLLQGHDVDTPAAAITQPNFVVSWADNRTGRDEVYVARSQDGLTWVETALSTSSVGGGRYPVFPRATPNASVRYLVWTSSDYPGIVASAYSADGGLSWPSVLPVSSASAFDFDAPRATFDTGTNALVAAYLRGNGFSTFVEDTRDLFVTRLVQ
jgi:hypothetical protein